MLNSSSLTEGVFAMQLDIKIIKAFGAFFCCCLVTARIFTMTIGIENLTQHVFRLVSVCKMHYNQYVLTLLNLCVGICAYADHTMPL